MSHCSVSHRSMSHCCVSPLCVSLLPVSLLSVCLQANSDRVHGDLESEFTSLNAVLDQLKDGMLTRIKQERASRTYELQVN